MQFQCNRFNHNILSPHSRLHLVRIFGTLFELGKCKHALKRCWMQYHVETETPLQNYVHVHVQTLNHECRNNGSDCGNFCATKYIIASCFTVHYACARVSSCIKSANAFPLRAQNANIVFFFFSFANILNCSCIHIKHRGSPGILQNGSIFKIVA